MMLSEDRAIISTMFKKDRKNFFLSGQNTILTANSSSFRVFIYSVRASFKNMALMVFLMLVAALIFSAVIFYCDRSQFTSIPDAIWWAIVTMTTVGYGDLVPKSLLGKMHHVC
jgi:voltage-gated potassium channel Kch